MTMFVKIIIYLVLALPMAAIAQTDNLKIEVTLRGMPDGTLFYLNEDKNNIDSSVSKGEKLIFSYTKPDQAPKGLLIISQDMETGYLFWIENKHLKLKGTYQDPQALEASGSRTQDEFRDYELRSKGLEDSVDQLDYQLRAARKKKRSDTTELTNKIEPLKRRLKDINTAFIKSHPNSVISTYVLLLETLHKIYTKDESLALFQQLSKNQQNSEYGAGIVKVLENYSTPQIGDKAPLFTIKDANGNAINIADYKGKHTILIFWASWCVPCRKEVPNIKKAYEILKMKNVVFIGISLDEQKNNWIKAIQADKPQWINGADLKGRLSPVALKYGITAIPRYILIDADGQIVANEDHFSSLLKHIR